MEQLGQLRSVPTVTTAIILMPALRMATTGRATSLMASSLAPAPGITATMGAVFTDAATTGVAVIMAAVTMVTVTATLAQDMAIGARTVAGIAAVIPADSTAAATASTVGEAAAFTAEAVTVEATANQFNLNSV